MEALAPLLGVFGSARCAQFIALDYRKSVAVASLHQYAAQAVLEFKALRELRERRTG